MTPSPKTDPSPFSRHVAVCWCGFQASALTRARVNEALADHVKAALVPDQHGTWRVGGVPLVRVTPDPVPLSEEPDEDAK